MTEGNEKKKIEGVCERFRDMTQLIFSYGNFSKIEGIMERKRKLLG